MVLLKSDQTPTLKTWPVCFEAMYVFLYKRSSAIVINCKNYFPLKKVKKGVFRVFGEKHVFHQKEENLYF